MNEADPITRASRGRKMLLALIAVVALGGLAFLAMRYWISTGRTDKTAASTEPRVAAEGVPRASNQVRLSPEAIKHGQIETAQAAGQIFHQKLTVTGRLSINDDQTARVGTFVPGRVTRVLATVGDYVKKGQALIYLHSHELLAARAAYAKAQAMVTEKEKSVAYAKAELERAERLLEAKAISRREQAHAAANLAAAASELDQARAEMERSSEWLQHLTVPHDSHDDVVINAPISGVVLKRSVTLGTVVNEATDLITIANLGDLWAVAEVPEQQAGFVRIGQPVEIRVSAFGDSKFPGRVAHIGEVLDPQTRTVQVRCLVNNPRGNLRPEMYATVTIDGLGQSPGQISVAVPRDAVQDTQGEKVVFLAVGDGVFEKRPVQTGREQDGLIEIVSGLQKGELVVTRGGFLIKSEFLKSTMSEE